MVFHFSKGLKKIIQSNLEKLDSCSSHRDHHMYSFCPIKAHGSELHGKEKQPMHVTDTCIIIEVNFLCI